MSSKLYKYVKKCVDESIDEVRDIINCEVENYVAQYKLSKSAIKKIKGDGVESDLLNAFIAIGSNKLPVEFRISQLAMVNAYGRGVYNTITRYISAKYDFSEYHGYKEYIFGHIVGILAQYKKYIFNDCKQKFVAGLMQNEIYKRKFVIISQNKAELMKIIGDAIPERMPDLYPLARMMRRHFVLHIGPTNSGKTYDAIKKLAKADSGIYLSPLRLLAYEVYDKINGYGTICSMITGEEEIMQPGATHISSTIEALDMMSQYDMAVIDECQMIGDPARGGAWTRALLGLCAKEIHVCSDNSCVELVKTIIEECGDTYEVVEHSRTTPLVCDRKAFVFPQSVRKKDALIVFSKAACIRIAASLQSEGIKASMIYGDLPYDARMDEVARFVKGETDVVVATDAIGMGLNLPIERIVFLETRKYDGYTERPLNKSEIKQIAGRAGRKGMFNVGYYTAEYGKALIATAVNEELNPIEYARMDIPESLIYLDYPLSQIIKMWKKTDNNSIYIKEKISSDLAICDNLEFFVEDKKTLFDFISIGYRCSKGYIMSLLVECAEAEVLSDNVEEAIDELIDRNAVIFDEELDQLSLAGLEKLYMKYDQIYAYLRKFKHRRRIEDIKKLKRDCSMRISKQLREQDLGNRTCPCCGEVLSWNYPYIRCRGCVNAS